MDLFSLASKLLYIPIKENLAFGIFVGYTVIFSVALFLNKLGDIMFKRGFAKPFYFLGHRIHHRDVLFFVLPLMYTTIIMLIVSGLIRIEWGYFWDGILTVTFLSSACLVIDLLFDRYSSQIRKILAFPHEVLYLSVPIYAFTHFLIIV